MDLSIVIPVDLGETAWRELLTDLDVPGAEILLVSPEPAPTGLPDGTRWLTAEAGRARQLNAGAHAANGRWLWFLHADSRLPAPAVGRALALSGGTDRALYFFDLRFSGGPRWMALNAAGVWLRSRLGKMPFGDQGFLVPAAIFRGLGGFPEGLAYGEDHVFVWAARRAGIPVLSTRCAIITSARKYRQRGWARATIAHATATVRQAAGEWRKTAGMRTRRGALAIFVKTPGLSPIKTRLAGSADERAAMRFYEQAIRAMEALGRSLEGELAVYWAVAESAAARDPRWGSFPAIAQGPGGLGERLGRVYERLFARHQRVFLVGCDAPQLSATDLRTAGSRLDDSDFVLGPAADGGFYLFGGRKYLEPALWRSVPYSAATTRAELRAALTGIGTIAELKPRTDVDTAADLAALRREIAQAVESDFSLPHWRILQGLMA